MDLSDLAALVVVWLAAVASPGPDIVQIVRLGSRRRSSGVWCALGIMTGNTGWIVATLAGLALLVAAYPGILVALEIAGGCFLAWMGFSSIRGGLQERRGSQPAPAARGGAPAEPGAATAASTRPAPGPLKSWRTGVVTNLANPKAMIFFGAVFAQVAQPGTSIGWLALAAVVLIVVGVAWFVGVAFAVGALSRWLSRHGAAVDIVTGAILFILGIVLVAAGIGNLGTGA